MADDTITNDPVEQAPVAPVQQSPAQDRIKQLSEKVELTSKERDELKTLQETTARERDFYKEYSNVISKHPNAKDHQDAIKEKVLKGYSVEDATYAVLGPAGKLENQSPPPQPNVAGGSADTIPPQAQKEPKDMTQADRRAILEKELMWS